MENLVEQKVLRIDARAQNNTPNLDSYLKSGWIIKFAFYIECESEIQYILERANHYSDI